MQKIQEMKLKPVIYFPRAGISRSFWLVFFVSLISGFAAGFLGIGGGLVRFFALVYFIGCPPVVAVGTDLFEVMISGLYGGATYFVKNRVDLISVLIMLSGALAGTKIGAVAVGYVQSLNIKMAFMMAVSGCLLALIFKVLHLSTIALFIIFLTVIVLSCYIFFYFIKGKRECSKKTLI